MRKINRLATIPFVAGLFLVIGGLVISAPAQTLTHTVDKGDTLWSICEKYYGNSDLWPKLWEMNPFVTNPHLLKAGDVVRLFEEPNKKMAQAPIMKEGKEEAIIPKEAPVREKGIDVSGMTSVESMGFFSLAEVESWGRILPVEGGRVMFSENDTVNLAIEGEHPVNLGDAFFVYESNPLSLGAFSRKIIGYTVSMLGKVVVTEEIEKSNYRGKIIKTYKGIEAGNGIIPYRPVSPCIKPVPAKSEFASDIVGVKGGFSMIGLHSVVYLDHGYNNGALRGNLLELVDKAGGKAFGEMENAPGPSGYMLVVEARPDTATCVVVSTRRETLKDAVSVRSVAWTAAQDVLANLPKCMLE